MALGKLPRPERAMLEKINGLSYKNMLDYGVRNLNKHIEIVNNLNVFPVPDGDTGTNMVMTIKNGLHSVSSGTEDLSTVASRFGNAVVFGARGNSGVIVSQFLKGVSECFVGREEADCPLFLQALERGVDYAHKAVSNPVDGTILTVIREATAEVRVRLPGTDSIDEMINVFLDKAKIALEHTPEQLPVLKDAGVVDSGGAGVVYFFEGIKKYLDGETLETTDTAENEPVYVDYSVYNKNSSFDLGYCTEFLVQILDSKVPFDYESLKSGLEKLGESIVTSWEGDKFRVHIHTAEPEKAMAFCHQYGEFLNLKIENMTVQHTQLAKKIVTSTAKSDSVFAVVVAAPDMLLQEVFMNMGADVVIVSGENPSSNDFIEAFDACEKNEILVFPNSSNSILAAMQGSSLYKKKKRISVLNSRSVAECYSALALIDFDETDTDVLIDRVNESINGVRTVCVARSARNMSYRNQNIFKDQYIAMSGDDLLAAGQRLEDVAVSVVNNLMRDDEYSVLTIFYGANVSSERMEALVDQIGSTNIYLEIYTIATEDKIHDLTISFE